MRTGAASGKLAVTVALLVALTSLGLIVLIGSRRGAESLATQSQPAAPAPEPAPPVRLEPEPPAAPEAPPARALALHPGAQPPGEKAALAVSAPTERYRARWQRAVPPPVSLEPPAPTLRPSGVVR